MNVNAGELNKHIQIYRKNGTPALVHSCWAKFSQANGSTVQKAEADWGEVKVRFLIRYTRKELDRKMFVRYAGTDYEIEYINGYGDNRRYIEIWCKAGSQKRRP